MSKTTKDYDRESELYDLALMRMCDKTDFDPTQWLNADEEAEYIKLLELE